MKLIIDITEEDFKDCQYTLATPFELSPLIERHCAMIVNGIPIEEIKADIYYESWEDKNGRQVIDIITVNEILDRELNKCEQENK